MSCITWCQSCEKNLGSLGSATLSFSTTCYDNSKNVTGSVGFEVVNVACHVYILNCFKALTALFILAVNSIGIAADVGSYVLYIQVPGAG